MTEKPMRKKRTANRGGTVKTSPVAITRWERDLRNVELRKAGATWQAIAETLHYTSAGNAYTAFMGVLREYPREDVETWRNIISDRYESMICVLWPKVVKGNLSAIDRVTRICEAQAKLMGTNRVEKLDVSVGAADLDAALRALEEELRMRAQGQLVPQE